MFDVDKLFLATTSYRDGEIEKMTDLEDFANNTEGAVGNKLLYDYMQIISDGNTFADARASIDDKTNKIKKELLPILREKLNGYVPGMYCLLPSFQARRKMEFSTGKDGIGPFALNVTNMALTQFAHLSMRYANNNEFGFGRLDAVLGKDGERISAWLSAMVNAHVDVAKDPYIFDINVNKATYNHVNFLIRAGMGMSTFTYIAQPILKEYAQRATTSGGLYGANLTGAEYEIRKSSILKELKTRTRQELQQALATTVFDNADEYAAWNEAVTMILTKPSSAKSPMPDKFSNPWKYVMDEEEGKKAIQNLGSLQSIYFQYVSLLAFDKIDVYAKELSDLVQMSLIDTKKFGNNVADHINFLNRYDQFKNQTRQVLWYITSDVEDNDSNKGKDLNARINDVVKEKGLSYALRKYFSDTFLDDKLTQATNLTRQILRSLTYTATDHFRTIMVTLLRELMGEEKWQVNGQDRFGYTPVLDSDIIKSIASAIDNIMRFKVLMNSKVDTDGIDFTYGGDLSELYKDYSRILYGESLEDTKEYIESINSDNTLTDNDLVVYNVHRSKSIFLNLSECIDILKNYPNEPKVAGLVNGNGEITNEFLKYIFPQAPSADFPVGRITLGGSLMNVSSDEKSVLRSAFDQLFRSKSLRFRLLAEDLAKYAYYSSFDTNTPNSFFDLVPTERRKQYDRSLANGLTRLDNKQLGMILAPKSESFFEDFRNKETGIAEEFLELVARNYYNDDNIVPVYTEHGGSRVTSPDQVLSGKRDNFFGEEKFNSQQIGTSIVHGIIVTSFTSKPYFKVVKGGETYLYKRVGNIKYSYGPKAASTGLGVYKLIPKLGIHSGSTHYYEFFSASEVNSIFKENSISSKFKLAGQERLDTSSFGAWLNQQKAFDDDGNQLYLYFEKTQIVETPTGWFEDGSPNLGANAAQAFRSDSGLVRFVGVYDKEGGKNYVDRNTNAKITFDTSRSAVDMANEIMSQLNDSYKTDQGVKLAVDMNHEVMITQKEFNDFMNLQLQLERERLINKAEGEVNEELIKRSLDEFRETKSAEIREQLKYNKMSDTVYDVLSQLLLNGYIVQQLYMNQDGMYFKAVSSAVHELRPNITQISAKSGEVGRQRTASVDPMVILYNRDDFDTIEKFSNMRDQYSEDVISKVLSTEQQLTLASISNYIYAANESMQAVAEQAEKVKQEGLKSLEASLLEFLNQHKDEVELENIREDGNDHTACNT